MFRALAEQVLQRVGQDRAGSLGRQERRGRPQILLEVGHRQQRAGDRPARHPALRHPVVGGDGVEAGLAGAGPAEREPGRRPSEGGRETAVVLRDPPAAAVQLFQQLHAATEQVLLEPRGTTERYYLDTGQWQHKGA